MIDLISADLGQDGAIAVWEGGFCYEVRPWSFNNKLWISRNVFDIVTGVKDIVALNRCQVVLERPSRSMHIQWVMYNDIRAVADEFRCRFSGYVPPTIKKVVAGYGRASKSDMSDAVLNSGMIDVGKITHLLPNEHIIDAIAVGICYYRSIPVGELA